ncbi:hypothetical protein [Fibrobacter sp.]|uniref:hypothetical protein n=1 Tax=Fibrobacter sp. TaxID=35828 RepID=UPI0025C50625|nr:hypothetical protein [Fibrobacter sp.]MBR3071783.1 hypothetical protein [Fibrobacter sp.]
MNFKVIFAAASLFATQAFAIAGIGFHYSPNVGTTLKSGKQAPLKVNDKEYPVEFSHGDFDYIQGFGFKAWIDILPFVDVEGTFNIQFASYNATLWADGEPHRLEIELGGTPFAKATPKFIAMNADISVTKPFSIPLFPIRPYVGAGLTIYWNTFILNNAFVEGVLERSGKDLSGSSAKEIADALAKNVVDAAKDKGLNKSVGFHLLAGARFKLPIIPIAAYANVKVYLGGEYDSDIDAGHVAFELGGGFAL